MKKVYVKYSVPEVYLLSTHYIVNFVTIFVAMVIMA